MSLHARSRLNVENPTREVKATKPAANLGLRRAALGEIGNRVLHRSNSTTEKSNTAVNKPLISAPKPTVFVKPTPKTDTKFNRSQSVTSFLTSQKAKEAVLVKLSDDTYVPKSREDDLYHIDDGDEDPLLVGDFVYEIHEYLRHVETKFPIREQYMANHIDITPKMRTTLVDWLVEVQQQYHLLQETLFLTVQILDRYLQEKKTLNRRRLQLAGVTSMFIASKYEEIASPDVGDFVYITDSSYSKHQIFAMEIDIMKTLDFQLCRPISLTFLRRYSKVAKVEAIHHNFSKYFLELAMMEYSWCHINPSLQAAASLYLAMSIVIFADVIWDCKLAHYSTYEANEVKKVSKLLAMVAMKAANDSATNTKYEAVRKKYSASKMFKVSLRPENRSEVLAQFASNS